MRTIRSIFLGLSFALVLLISIIVILAYYNKDGLTNYIIDEVNKQLEVKVDVDEVNLRLFKKFPYASIELNNVVAFTNDYYNKRVLGYNTDTLFRANNLFLQFHLIDILTKKYRIKTVHFDKANINLFINKQSKVNYNFVKTSKDKSKDTSSYVLNINELKITNSKILYCNAAKNIVFDTKIDKTVLKGNFYKDKFDLKLSITNYINQLSIKSKIYLKNISTKFDCNINVDSNKYFVKSADLAINNCSFNISGVIVKNDETEIDLGVVTSDSKIKNFINIIPDTLIKKYAKNIIKGDIRISTTVKGSFSKNTMPSIISDISLSKGEYLLNNTKIKSIKFEGAYSNGAQNNSITSSIVIDDAYVEINKSNFSGELEIKNFDFPKLKINSKAKLYLNEIPDMFENDTIEQMDGTADIKFGYAGDIDKFELYNIFSPSFYCDVMIDNALLKIKNSKYKLENITGFTSINEDVYINDLYFEINESDFLLNGLASNMYNYLKSNDDLYLKADVKSNKFKVDNFIKKKDSGNENNISINFPEKISMQLKVNINDFIFSKFEASKIKGKVNYKPRMFTLREVSFNTMAGSARFGGVAIQKYNKDLVLQSQSNLENIDIKKLFSSFNNFGQDFILDNNMKGNITGNIFLSSQWANNLKIYEEKINCESDFVIKNGELNDFEPMQGLSRFVDVDELKNIKFSTLKNKISIKDKKMIIPNMDIKSNAFNITASGAHNFDNNYSYNIKLSLKEILAKKAKKNMRKKNPFGVIEDDGLGNTFIYLNITGDSDDFKIKYDKATARSVRRENFKQEKLKLKTILNQEFGFFKNDTSIKNNTKEKNTKFQIDWDKENKKKKQKNKSDNNKFTIEWEED